MSEFTKVILLAGVNKLVLAIMAGLLVFSLWPEGAEAQKLHVLELNQRVLYPDDGLILGNGDLSASVYQTGDRIIWRLGKGDVWDRRHDLSDDPRPLDIEEMAHGIKVEGWKAEHHQFIQALHGTDNPERTKEVSKSVPSYHSRPYPCPKPVGELSVQLPLAARHTDMKISQRLVIEEGRLEITCSWPGGGQLTVDSFIVPSPNVLVIHWKAENCPVWMSLYRWADPTLKEYGARLVADTRHRVFRALYNDPKVTPLAPPETRDGYYDTVAIHFIEQVFAPDPLFEKGFRYWLVPFTAGADIKPADMQPLEGARIQIMPEDDANEGWLAVHVPTSSDPGGVENECHRIRETIYKEPAETMKQWREDTIRESEQFWAKSGVTIADPIMENLWYQILHARRCIYRDDTVPPGLFMPSTIGDYSVWHGDYHWNYNFEAPFWGNYTANHFEIGDAYFQAMDYMLQIGRKIAHDYYHCRGAFIQLTGYPIHALDDPYGVGNLSRMAYMTGWAMQPYWWRYQYSQDKDWLREKGYPVIRDCALFFTDFLNKGDDGLYHAFPSCEEESKWTGDPNDYTDRAEVMQHIRYSLRAAILASKELGVDEAFRAEWQDRLDNMAPDNNKYFGNQYDPSLAGLEKWCAECSPAQWGYGKPYDRQPREAPSGASPLVGRLDSWWIAHPGGPISMLRDGRFVADRDYDVMREFVETTRHPNGLMFTASAYGYHTWVFNEELAIIAPLQEMMLQSWDGILRIFPAWPTDVEASFRTFRAQGAFLVSASWANGAVTSAEILSEVGGRCRLYPLWAQAGVQVTDDSGQRVPVVEEPEGGVVYFETQAGHTYKLARE